MSSNNPMFCKTTLFKAGGLVLAPYLCAVLIFWLGFSTSVPSLSPGGHALGVVLAGLIILGVVGTAGAAYLLRRYRLCESFQENLDRQAINEKFIEAGKMASIGELAAGIAHEINNPVAIMVEEAGWMGDLLEEDEDFAKSQNFEEFKRSLKQIRTQGARCKDITHKMLSFARKSDLRIQDIDLNMMINEVTALSEKRARYANCRIELDLAEDIPTISASASEMQQIILNLINNALDAMEEKGGTLTIITRKSENRAEISIADTGMGIPPANLTRIFDPFYTTKPVGKGTGLGLSICYTIIKNMGGDIRVRSQVDQGTTFTIRLPLTSGTPEKPSVP